MMNAPQHATSAEGLSSAQALVWEQVAQAARRHGWTDAVREHALREALSRTPQDEARAATECVSETTAGMEVRCPAWPLPCTYVRVCQGGFEVGYWLSEQWRDQPEEVAGAIFGTLAQADENPENDLQLSLEDTLNNALEHEGAASQRGLGQASDTTPDLQETLSRGSVTTYALGNGAQGQKELLKFEVRLADLSNQDARALLNAEHHDIAMSRARALGMRNVVVFDETSPAAKQMRQLVGTSETAPVKVLIEVSGGLVKTVSADQPSHVLILDYDVEGSSDANVMVRGQKACASAFVFDARDAASGKAEIDLVFNEALAHETTPGQAEASHERPAYERARS